jgi:predicted O-methyltransferase YrrM
MTTRSGDHDRWAEVDRYLTDRLIADDPALEAAIEASTAAGLPPHEVAPNQGKLLELLARAAGATRVLELGTLGGYSTICLARALPPGGSLITLESVPEYAEVARANIERAGLSAAVEVRVGPALETLPQLRGPFDLIFIDADKQDNPEYIEWALRLSRPGTLILADNVVRGGAVIDPGSDDPSVHGVRRFVEMVADEPRLSATAIQTVGSKGWDGFVLALVGAEA